MGLRDVGQAVAAVAVAEDSNPVDLERTPADMPALQPGPAHAGTYPFDDEVAFQFCDRADDDDHGPPQRAAGVEVLAEADELDIQPVKLVQDFKEVSHGPGDPVRGPHQHHLETASAGIAEQIIEPRPASFRFMVRPERFELPTLWFEASDIGTAPLILKE